jgi:hypothetical protein
MRFLPAAEIILFFTGLKGTADAGGRPLRFEADELANTEERTVVMLANGASTHEPYLRYRSPCPLHEGVGRLDAPNLLVSCMGSVFKFNKLSVQNVSYQT